MKSRLTLLTITSCVAALCYGAFNNFFPQFFSDPIQYDCPENPVDSLPPKPVEPAQVACSGDFYDPGGPNGNYNDFQGISTTICPDVPGQFVRVEFSSFDTELCCDYLTVYDEQGSWGEFLGEYSGNTLPPVFYASNPSGCLTFNFNPSGVATGSGWAASISCIACPAPNLQKYREIASDNARFFWDFNPQAAEYQWEVGLPGFTPGSGSAVSSGATSSYFDTVHGLISNTEYEFYIRTLCGNGLSEFAGPFRFTTAPGCGEVLYDGGGPNASFPSQQQYWTVLCPDTPGEYVAVDFTEFNLPPNAGTLYIYEGDPQNYSFLASLQGDKLPSPVNATIPSGCLIFNLLSGAGATDSSDWAANVSCSACPFPNQLTAYDAKYDGISLSWSFVSPGGVYEWEIVEANVAPGTGNGVGNLTGNTGNGVIVNGLESATAYDAYVRLLCSSGDTSLWKKTTFQTAPTCGDSFYDIGGPDGDYPAQISYPVTICPDLAGTYVSVDFDSFNLGDCCAQLTIYDLDYEANLIGYYFEDNSPGVVTATNSTGCLTFRFEAYGAAGPGWEASVSCISCPNPRNLNAFNIGLNTAEIRWDVSAEAVYYQWEIVPAGAPPGSGLASASGNSSATQLFVVGLESGTAYDLYVRANCGGSDFSIFSGPFHFNTIPTCGDSFFDPGGPFGDFTPNDYVTTTICPDQPGQLVSVTFTEFDLTPCCGPYLVVTDGQFAWDPQIGFFNGSAAPTTITANNTSGCLTFTLNPGGYGAPGWAASVSCVTCPGPSGIGIQDVTKTGAMLSWNPSLFSQTYLYEVGLNGFTPGAGQAVTFGSITNNASGIDGLQSGTAYEAYIRSVCGPGDTSTFSGPVKFVTSPSCGEYFLDPGGADEDYPNNQYSVTTICPEQPGTFVQLVFEEWDLPCCGDLTLVNNNATWGEIIGYFRFDLPAPTVVSATNPTGCITAIFNAHGDTTGAGWKALVECITCPSPYAFAANNLEGGSAQLDWSQIAGVNAYQWEVGLPGFQPGAGAALFTGQTGAATVDVTNLDGNITYEGYVRSICSPGDTSRFTGPISFTMLPTCGDKFYDSGGPDSNYLAGVYSSQRLCPRMPGEFVQLVFDTFSVNPCCASMYIYDDFTSYQFSGNQTPPVITSNSFDGCLTVNFDSPNGAQTLAGWEATIHCIACPKPNRIEGQQATASTLLFNWSAVPTAASFYWETGLAGFTPGTGNAVDFQNTNDSQALTEGLESQTTYDIYVRVNCSNGETSDFAGPFTMTTAPSCDEKFYDPGGPDSTFWGNNQFLTTIICPEISGQFVAVSFSSFQIDPFNDYLEVYNWNHSGVNYLGYWNGANSPGIITADNPTGCLTFLLRTYSQQVSPGWEATIACLNCQRVSGVQAVDVQSESAIISWNSLPNAVNYEWELGPPGFTPGTGAAIEYGTSNTFSVQLNGLESGTFYHFYVRANCEGGDVGAFSPAFPFRTSLNCGDFFYDTGGPNGNYSTYENYYVTLCSPVPGEAVSVTFTEFSTESCCDYLSVYNGTQSNGTFIGSYSGGSLPGPFTSTDPSGCLTFFFQSDGSVELSGWAAQITCANGCTAPVQLVVNDVTANSASLNWTGVAVADSYLWEVGSPGFVPGTGAALQQGEITPSQIIVTGLTPNVNYHAYVKSVCDTNQESDFTGPVAFSTDPSSLNQLLNFDQAFSVSPNPTHGACLLTLEYPQQETATLEVNDIAGRRVQEKSWLLQTGRNVFSLDLTTLPPGSYLVKVRTELGLAVRRLVKE